MLQLKFLPNQYAMVFPGVSLVLLHNKMPSYMNQHDRQAFQMYYKNPHLGQPYVPLKVALPTVTVAATIL